MSRAFVTLLLLTTLLGATLASGGAEARRETPPPRGEIILVDGAPFVLAEDEAARLDGDRADVVETWPYGGMADRSGLVPVYYPAGESPSEGNRLFGTAAILIVATAFPDFEGTRVREVVPILAAPGRFLGLVADAWEAPAAAEEMKGRAGVLDAYAALAWFAHTRFSPNDPLYPNQWHLENTGQGGGVPGVDANVELAWDVVTGSGIVISVVDDGVQHTHPDLAANYNAAGSWDWCSGDANPTPPAGSFHGTAVAGVAAGVGDNSLGVAGSAFDAQFSAQRLISCGFTSATEASALGAAADISSNSWGPSDDGQTLQAMPGTVLTGVQNAVNSGRGGLGIVYVWANGNGRGNFDDGNYDGRTNSRYMISVGAIGNNGEVAGYAETCTCMLVTAPSNGGTLGITTTDIVGPNGYSATDYTASFGGTSSATPLVAGVVALVLDANPSLTWRDVQAILALTARKVDLSDPEWITNAAGHSTNRNYGFGMVDAAAAVQAATNWANLPPESIAEASSDEPCLIPDGGASFGTPGAPCLDKVNVWDDGFVDRVEIQFDVTHPARGDVRMILESPSGTQSMIIPGRPFDEGDNFVAWKATSTQFFGEDRVGEWTLRTYDVWGQQTGTIHGWTLRIYGTETAMPEPIPEMGTLILALAGLGALALVAARRKAA